MVGNKSYSNKSVFEKAERTDVNVLDFTSNPTSPNYRDSLAFSDQGVWFAYGFPEKDSVDMLGFTGPFLMTQQNGVWISPSIADLSLLDEKGTSMIDAKSSVAAQDSYASHLEQVYGNDKLKVVQKLVFLSPHTALQRSEITNISGEVVVLDPNLSGALFDIGITFRADENLILLASKHSDARGFLQVFDDDVKHTVVDRSYISTFEKTVLNPNESKTITLAQTYIFPKYSWEEEKRLIAEADFNAILKDRIAEKQTEIKAIKDKLNPIFADSAYHVALEKAHLTLQNNWRVPAGEIKRQGLFSSYHYPGFNGFWAWDSWKHAVGLAYYNPELAKDQVRLMFDFQKEDGFVIDCVFRDTKIEKNNERDTKPPLAAWAVKRIYDQDRDLEFVKELYPKLVKYHDFWYAKRDHDQDGLCEYGSTDGTLEAAKWESGMDNAIRFDDSKILKNGEGAYSLNQESVDLNAYLYAEKLFLADLADAQGLADDAKKYRKEAEGLKIRIQEQFYDANDGWFYDTNLEGDRFIKGEGSEGWTALWAEASTQEQAEAVKNRMLDPEKFYTKVPFQTMSADHTKFDPYFGYWRGPNWLDQSYFGVKALRNYGFNSQADRATRQILEGAEGLMRKGPSIRENYHPLTGEGLHAHNFSWSAAHVLMLLMER